MDEKPLSTSMNNKQGQIAEAIEITPNALLLDDQVSYTAAWPLSPQCTLLKSDDDTLTMFNMQMSQTSKSFEAPDANITATLMLSDSTMIVGCDNGSIHLYQINGDGAEHLVNVVSQQSNALIKTLTKLNEQQFICTDNHHYLYVLDITTPEIQHKNKFDGSIVGVKITSADNFTLVRDDITHLAKFDYSVKSQQCTNEVTIPLNGIVTDMPICGVRINDGNVAIMRHSKETKKNNSIWINRTTIKNNQATESQLLKLKMPRKFLDQPMKVTSSPSSNRACFFSSKHTVSVADFTAIFEEQSVLKLDN